MTRKELSNSLYEANVTLIPKSDKGTMRRGKYRPRSLTDTDTKPSTEAKADRSQCAGQDCTPAPSRTCPREAARTNHPEINHVIRGRYTQWEQAHRQLSHAKKAPAKAQPLFTIKTLNNKEECLPVPPPPAALRTPSAREACRAPPEQTWAEPEAAADRGWGRRCFPPGGLAHLRQLW